MWRRYGDEDALLPNVNFAQAMGHSDCHETMLIPYRASDGLQSTESQWGIGRVRKMRDCFAVERVARATYRELLFSLLPDVSTHESLRPCGGEHTSEQNHGASFGAFHFVHHGFGIELVVGQ